MLHAPRNRRARLFPKAETAIISIIRSVDSQAVAPMVA
jgi:hypothetical protein